MTTSPRASLLGVRACAAGLFVCASGACGYSEDAMRARLREIDGLAQQLAAEASQNREVQLERDEARAKVVELERQLGAADVDVDRLDEHLSAQARALEEHERNAALGERAARRGERLQSKLADLADAGVRVVVRTDRLVVVLAGDLLFGAGRDVLDKEGAALVARVAAALTSEPELAERDLQVVVHTDDRPPRGAAVRDNWALSLLRAREIVLALVAPGKGQRGLDPARLSAAGHGGTQPVADNATEDGRRANRRCELVLLPRAEELPRLEPPAP